jgi:hypothetical protein
VTGYRFTDPWLSFLVFRSRSGSTFLGDRLSRHPEVLVTPESNIAPRIFKYFENKSNQDIDPGKLVDYIYSEQKFIDWKLPRKNLVNEISCCHEINWATTFYACCKAYRDLQKPEANLVIFKKSGWYYKNADLLLSTFTGSVTIWLLRDPRAVYNSARKALHSKKKKPMAANILENAFGWRDYANRLVDAQKKWPGRVLSVRYETLLNDYISVLTDLWRYLGVRDLDKFELKETLDQLRESHLVTPSTMHLHGNVSQEPIVERAEKWREELPRWRAVLIRLICSHGIRNQRL